ncbi:acyltransferase family protein [Pedobacter agri]|uniref:acyltransferase family protein n=1 Tax=Pedobacter agri TaxID=454586 RepID=UPI003977315D
MDKENHLIYGIQYLRGFAALGVVLCHYGSNLNDHENLSQLFNYVQCGVHIFFFISGYIITHSLIKNNYQIKDFPKFILKRHIRIDPAYIIVIILTLFTFYVLTFIPSFNGKPIPLIFDQFLCHILYIIPFTKYDFYNPVFWTLCVEFQFYILVGTLYFLLNTNWFRFLLLFCGSTLIPISNSYYLVSQYAPIFCLGISFMHIFEEKNRIYYLILLISFLVIYIQFGSIICCLLLISITVIIYTKKNIVFLNFLGTISYSLYITHSIVLVILLGIIKRISSEVINAQPLLMLIIEVFVALCISYFYHIVIEKPSIILSNKIFLKNKCHLR